MGKESGARPVSFAIPGDNASNEGTYMRYAFVLMAIQKLRHRIFFDTPNLNYGYCLERHEEEIALVLCIDPNSVQGLSLSEYRRLIRRRRKSKHWICVNVSDPDTDPITECGFSIAVSAIEAASFAKVPWKNLCFPCPNPNPSKGRKTSTPLRSVYHIVTRQERLGLQTLSSCEADAVLLAPGTLSMRLVRDKRFALIKCQTATSSEEITRYLCHFKLSFMPLRKRKYENLVKEHPNTKIFNNIGKNISTYPARMFYFEGIAGDRLQEILGESYIRELYAVPSRSTEFCLFSGVIEFFRTESLATLKTKYLLADINWSHINERYVMTSFKNTLLASEDAVLFSAGEVPRNRCRVMDTSKYVYWLDPASEISSLKTTVAKLPREGWWAGMVNYKDVGIIVKTTTCRSVADMPLLKPMEASEYRKIVRAKGSVVLESQGNMNLPIQPTSGKRSWKTKYWKVQMEEHSGADKEILILVAKAAVTSPNGLIIHAQCIENQVLVIKGKRNLVRRDLPRPLRDVSKPLTKLEYENLRSES
uniref:Scv016-like protein n=1 Tax=Metapenaeus ensis nimavirus TaxID=2133794 RepID=A0A401IPB1_9VIRU|nr:MAG: scv016-like protein [Metapenaeus ensis nimavirus]GBG35453.1 scv016-like protein [Metapenaeus ensis nimavirus]